MSEQLVPLMYVLTAAMLLGCGYSVYISWKTRHDIAWNVVGAVLRLRELDADGRQRLQATLQELLPTYGMQPESVASATPAVRFAFYSVAMHRLGLASFDSSQPFRPLKSPGLARSSSLQIRSVRRQVEQMTGTTLKELDTP